MHLIERFSSHLRDTLARSIQLATNLKNPAVEPVHLLLALVRQRGSLAAEILARFKLISTAVERAIVNLPVAANSAPASAAPGIAVAEQILSSLSPTAKEALEKAMLLAYEHKHAYIGTEHLLLALIELEDKLISEIITAEKIDQPELTRQIHAILANTAQFPQLNEVADLAEQAEQIAEEQAANAARQERKGKPTRKRESALDWFGINLTNPDVQKSIDVVVGRDREIERVIQILCRRTKNNPLLLGEPGVGKTAIVEGLAKKILNHDVPEPLLNKKIYSLDLGLIIAGTMYRGEFEARLKQVVEEVLANANIILFIDEIHNLVGAGSNQGTLDAANLLKPALARGQIRCIGATTPAEFKKYIESDAALERRFQPINVGEPSVADTIQILAGVKENYELFHRVKIPPEATAAAARLADRYLTNKFLPDKAIDLLDETAAAKRLAVKGAPAISRLARLEQKLEQTVQQKESAARADNFSEAVTFKKEEERLRLEIKTLAAKTKPKKINWVGELTAADVINQVAKIIGTAPSELLLDDNTELATLEAKLNQFVIGQGAVIHEVAALIRQARLGLGNPERPLCSVLFVGDSGVGKTELAKTLARVLYQDKDALIKLDMSEFSEAFGVSKLLGSPAGYVGYKEGNHLTDKLKLHPYCVLLFDEIDKAHAEVTKLLLQILENGELTDAAGKKISLRHAIIILTTTLGAEGSQGPFGFGQNRGADSERKKQVLEKLKEHFSPEIINRLDCVALFAPLGPAELARIAALELNRFNERLAQYHTSVTASEKVLRQLVAGLTEKKSSARDVRHLLRSQVEQLLSNLIVERELKTSYALGLEQGHLTVH